MSPFLTCFPYHRSPSACLEGTHGDRVAGDNTQHSHRLLSFSFYVTRSRTKRIQTRPLTCTIHQARRSLFSPPCGSCSVFEQAHTVYKNASNRLKFSATVISGVGVPPNFHQADNLAKLWQEFLSVYELIAQILCAVEIARTNAVFVNRQKCFCFYLGDSHVVSLLGMT